MAEQVTVKDPAISGRAFLQWLIDNGIVPYRTRRVVIDAPLDGVVSIYIEAIGTKKLIEVKLPEGLENAVKVVLDG